MFIKGYHKPYWPGWTKEAIGGPRVKTFMALGLPIGFSSVVDWASGAVAGSFSGWCGFEVAATQIRLARYLGEGKPEAAKRILKIGATTLLMGGVIICGLVQIYHNNLFKVWTSDPRLIETCDDDGNNCTGGILDTALAAYINLVSNNIASWVIYIPLAYFMPLVWNWGLSGFWWSDFFGELFKVICLAWGVSRVDWAEASKEARRKAQGSKEQSEKCEELEKDAMLPWQVHTHRRRQIR